MVNQRKVEKGISVEKQMLQEIRENFDPYEKRLPGVKHLRKQKSKDESQRSNLLRRVYDKCIGVSFQIQPKEAIRQNPRKNCLSD